MTGLTSLLDSRKAIVAIALILSATVLGVMGYLNAEQWISFAQWIGTAYMGAEALDSGLGKMGNSSTPAPVEKVDKPTEPIPAPTSHEG